MRWHSYFTPRWIKRKTINWWEKKIASTQREIRWEKLPFFLTETANIGNPPWKSLKYFENKMLLKRWSAVSNSTFSVRLSISAPYQVKVTTGVQEGAGTDANVYLTVYGTKGETMEKKLINTFENNFEKGKYVNQLSVDWFLGSYAILWALFNY